MFTVQRVGDGTEAARHLVRHLDPENLSEALAMARHARVYAFCISAIFKAEQEARRQLVQRLDLGHLSQVLSADPNVMEAAWALSTILEVDQQRARDLSARLDLGGISRTLANPGLSDISVDWYILVIFEANEDAGWELWRQLDFETLAQNLTIDWLASIVFRLRKLTGRDPLDMIGSRALRHKVGGLIRDFPSLRE